MRWVMPIVGFFAGVTGVALVALVCILIMVWSALAIVPERLGRDLVMRSLDYVGLNYFPEIETPMATQNAEMGHRKISGMIAHCLDLTSRNELSEYEMSILNVSLPYPSGDSPSDASSASKKLGAVSQRVAQLSQEITYTIFNFQKEADTNYVFFQNATFISIFLGLMTTVVVSVSSSKIFVADTKTDVSIKIMAILLPALGTALAAIIAFIIPTSGF